MENKFYKKFLSKIPKESRLNCVTIYTEPFQKDALDFFGDAAIKIDDFWILDSQRNFFFFLPLSHCTTYLRLFQLRNLDLLCLLLDVLIVVWEMQLVCNKETTKK